MDEYNLLLKTVIRQNRLCLYNSYSKTRLWQTNLLVMTGLICSVNDHLDLKNLFIIHYNRDVVVMLLLFGIKFCLLESITKICFDGERYWIIVIKLSLSCYRHQLHSCKFKLNTARTWFNISIKKSFKVLKSC